ncbi:MAG: aldehyde dehydrogenase [Saprospirales bacterium]|nr:MAG: aldehyde dehydrogenase [Saprospirales bacterium]
MKKILNFIGGDFREPVSGNYLDNFNPSTGEVYSLIPDSDKRDVDLAVKAAQDAFPEWSALVNEERSSFLRQISEGILSSLEDLAVSETTDNGKPLWLSRSVDIPRSSSNFRFFADATTQFASESHEMRDTAINYTLRQPLGVVGCISPWNLPLYLFTWKIAPALATGNTVVAKPSEVTPMTAYLLSKIVKEIGLPPGVLNIVHGNGPGAGEAIVTHDDVKAVSFTGGTSTGQRIAKAVAPHFKKVSLELGGKNPNIIFNDCNFNEALKSTMKSSFANQGQICLCGSRVLIQTGIYEQFRDALVERAEKTRVGDPMLPETSMGALVSEDHLNKVLEHVKIAEKEGGNVLCGGDRVKPAGRCKNGFFMRPTVIEGLSPECRTNQEEIFGPVVTLIPFETEEDALQIANESNYGLAATLWTSDVSRAHRMSSRLQFGIVWVNCWLLRDLRTPFGGMKNSGLGREGGWEAMRFFTEPKNVCIKWG